PISTKHHHSRTFAFPRARIAQFCASAGRKGSYLPTHIAGGVWELLPLAGTGLCICGEDFECHSKQGYYVFGHLLRLCAAPYAFACDIIETRILPSLVFVAHRAVGTITYQKQTAAACSKSDKARSKPYQRVGGAHSQYVLRKRDAGQYHSQKNRLFPLYHPITVSVGYHGTVGREVYQTVVVESRRGSGGNETLDACFGEV